MFDSLLSRLLVPVLGVLLALAVTTAGVQTWRLHSFQTEVAQQRAEVAQERAAQAEADRLHERAASLRNGEIDRATQTKIERDRRAAATTGADVDRLRNALVATAQDRANSATRCADDRAAVDRLAGALSACAGLVADGLRAGDALATQVSGLQSGAMPVAPAP